MALPRADGWSGVRKSMAAGAAFDLLFAAAILFFPAPSASALGLSLPEDPVYLGLVGVLLLLLGGLYVLVVLWPERYQGIAAVAAGGRLLGFAYLLQAWLQGRPTAFLGLAIADLALGATHAVSVVGARGAGRRRGDTR